MQVFSVYNGFAESLGTVAVENDPNGVAVRPGGDEVWVTNNQSDSVSIIETETYTVTHTIASVGNAPRRVIFGTVPAGQGSALRAYTVNAHGDSFSVIDAEDDPPTIIDEVFVDDDEEDQTSLPRGIALHPDQGDRPELYVTEFESMQVTIFESNDNYDELDEIDVSTFGSPHRIAITADGAKGYIANPDDDQVCILNVVTGEMIQNPVTVQNGPGGIAILEQ
jgi:YVTN family beta-propeller protein